MIIIPIEIYAREIEKACSLAAYLRANLDMPVLVAEQSLARKVAIALAPHSIFVGKHFFSIDSLDNFNNEVLQHLLAKGVNIIYTDEEGGLFLKENYHDYHVKRVHLRYPFSNISREYHDQIYILHWGRLHAEIMSDLPKSLIQDVSGPTWVDCSKIYKETSTVVQPESISFTQSSMLLSSPLFAFSNPPRSLNILCQSSSVNHTRIADQFSRELFMLNCLYNFSRESQEPVTFRPHPKAFRQLTTSSAFKFLKQANIKISIPWLEPIYTYLLSSDLFCHSGCTSSIQAALMGKLSIYLHPTLSDTWGPFISNEPRIRESPSSVHHQVQEIITSTSVNQHLEPKYTPLASLILDNISVSHLRSYRRILSAVHHFKSIRRVSRKSYSSKVIDDLLYRQYAMSSFSGLKRYAARKIRPSTFVGTKDAFKFSKMIPVHVHTAVNRTLAFIGFKEVLNYSIANDHVLFD